MRLSPFVVLSLVLGAASVARAEEPAAAPTAPAAVPEAAAPAATPALEAPAPAPAPAEDRDADLEGLPPVVRQEMKCKRDGDFKVQANLDAARKKVSDSYLAWVRGGATGAIGTADEFGLGWGLHADASVGLLSPLYLGGGMRWMSIANSSQFQLDAVAGLNFRSYGHEWIKAGSSTSGAVTYTWSGNCQVRRTDYSLVGGVKYVFLNGVDAEPGIPAALSTHAPALQFGIQQVQAREASSPLGGWSLAALYDPFNAGYGAQFSFTGQGVLIALPGPDSIYTGMSGGVLFSKQYATTPFWFTIDLGVGFEL